MSKIKIGLIQALQRAEDGYGERTDLLYGSAEEIIRRNVVILRGFDQKIQSALADSLFVM